MVETEKLRFCKGDWLAIAMVATLAISVILCFLPQNSKQAAMAQIYLNGELIKTVNLDQDQRFVVTDKYSNEITVEDGKITVTASDCPGQDCVHSGSIHNAGRILVCLPNGMEIRVISGMSDVDFVVG